MQQFFSSLVVIEQLTTTINRHFTGHICPFCHQSDQWISHGYLYKKSGQKVGKRILCAKRYGKSGCGHTQALYVSDVIPQRRYSLSVLLSFVFALVKGQTVEQAYYRAIGHTHSSPRQAWRWLNGLWANMVMFRLRLTSSEPPKALIAGGSRRLTVLLNTLYPCLRQCAEPEVIQRAMQCRFC